MRSNPVPAPATEPSCADCPEPSHDEDFHDHHWHPNDNTTYIGTVHPATEPRYVSLDDATAAGSGVHGHGASRTVRGRVRTPMVGVGVTTA